MRLAQFRRMSALSILAGAVGSAGCVHYHYHNDLPAGCGDGAVIQYGAPGVPVQTEGGVSSSSAGNKTISSRVVANPLQAQADGAPPTWRRSGSLFADRGAQGGEGDPTVDR